MARSARKVVATVTMVSVTRTLNSAKLCGVLVCYVLILLHCRIGLHVVFIYFFSFPFIVAFTQSGCCTELPFLC